MDLTKLTTTTLKSISGLTDKLSATINELKKIEQTILASLSNEAPAAPAAPAKRGPKPKAAATKAKAPTKKVEAEAPATKAPKTAKTPAAKKTGKRGAIKEQIVAALQKAGAKGISVKDLSTKLGVKPGNVHVWFATTGKTVGVEKIAPGVYRLKA